MQVTTYGAYDTVVISARKQAGPVNRRSSTPDERRAMGERLRNTAKAAGFTSDSMAERLGIQGGSVRGWWSGRNEPSFARLKAYSEAVGVSISFLVFGSERPMGPVGTLQEWRIRYADLIAQGIDPAEAVDRISAEMPLDDVGGIPVDELTPGERDLLVGQGVKLRLKLNQMAGGHWLDLTPEQKEVVLRLIETMARENQRLRSEPPPSSNASR